MQNAKATDGPVVLSQGSAVLSLAVLADGWLASGGQDGKIKLWIVDQKRLIAALCKAGRRNFLRDKWNRDIDSDWQPSCRPSDPNSPWPPVAANTSDEFAPYSEPYSEPAETQCVTLSGSPEPCPPPNQPSP